MKYPDRSVVWILLAMASALLSTSKIYGQCTASIGSSIDPVAGCELLSVQFYDISTGVVNRSWDFGDGSELSNAQNPTHSFEAGQGDTIYTVTLTIECAAGGTSTASRTVTVYAKPQVDFSLDRQSLCAISDSVCFMNQASYTAGNNYFWNFGDGTISNKYEPCKIYTTAGTYSLELTVTNEHGCVNSLSMEDYIEVIPVPNTAFSVSRFSGCSPLIVFFTNNTDTLDNSYSDWTWNFDDETFEENGFQAQPHTFQQSGKYNVKLGTWNELGCYNFSTQTITVNPSPEVDFSIQSPICGNEYTVAEFTGTASDSAIFSWDFSNPSQLTGSGGGPLQVSWSSAGIKNVELVVSDLDCSASMAKSVVVNPLSKVYLSISASLDTICEGQDVTFTASPSSFLNYQFYKNTTLLQESQENTYTGTDFSSDDRIYVKINDYNGCSELLSDTVKLTVLPSPVVSLTSGLSSDSLCSGDPLTLIASPAAYDEYVFYLGNEEINRGSSESYTMTGVEDGSSFQVQAVSQGCISQHSNPVNITVTDPPPATDVNCGTTTSDMVRFTWDALEGARGYEVSVNGGDYQLPSDGIDGLFHHVDGLSEWDSVRLTVRAMGDASCGYGMVSDTCTCVARDCAPVTFELLDQDIQVCLGEDVTLGISVQGISSYSVSWDGGALSGDTTWTTLVDGDMSIPVVVKDSAQEECPAGSRNFRIYSVEHPSVSVSVEGGTDLCSGESMKLVASPGTYQRYIFYRNSQIIKDGPENYFVEDEVQDGKYYYVLASNDDCLEASDSIQPTLQTPLQAPVVNVLYSDPVSLCFGWDAVEGSTGYMISINNGEFELVPGGEEGLLYPVTDLESGESVVAVVYALGSDPCGDSEMSLPASGFAETCEEISFEVSTSFETCSGEEVSISIREISIDNYSIQWGNEAPSSQYSRSFYPVSDTLIRVLILNEDQALCPGRSALINVTVHTIPSRPEVSCSEPSLEICEEETLSFTASPAGYDYYEFYTGYQLLQYGTDHIYQTSEWGDGEALTVRAGNGGCFGEFSNPLVVQVEAPLNLPQVNCASSTDSSIHFSWDPVPDAEGYLVSLDGGSYLIPSTGNGGVLHVEEGLTSGEYRCLSVMALGSGPCGNSTPSEPVTCRSIQCDSIGFSIQPYDSICQGESLQLEISGITPDQFSVSWNGVSSGNDTTQLFDGLEDSIVSVQLYDLDQPECPSVGKQFELVVHSLPSVSLFVTADTVCQGQGVRCQADPSGYDQYAFYNEQDSLLQVSDNHVFEVDSMLSSMKVYVQSWDFGCSEQSGLVSIEVTPLPELSLNSLISGEICLGETVEFQATPGFDRYFFRDQTKLLLESDQPVVSLSVHSTALTVEAVKGNDCMVLSQDTLHFDLLPLPTATMTASSELVCPGEEVSFVVEPQDFSSYDFYRGTELLLSSASSSHHMTFSEDTDSIYAVVEDANGCLSLPTPELTIQVIPFPQNSILASGAGICLGDSATLQVQFDPSMVTTAFYWGSGGRDTIRTVSPQYDTYYSLFSVANGCVVLSDSLTLGVDVEVPPVADAGDDVTICIFDSLQLVGRGGMTHSWEPASLFLDSMASEPWVRSDSTVTLVLTATNRFCSSTDTMILTIDLCLEDITAPVPQIITPNGDGHNDHWIVSDIDYFQQNRVVIFNRWGSEVFRAKPYENDFNGTNARGGALPEGTYYYLIDLGTGDQPHTGYLIIHR